ncbi:MAG: outer membrane beta-barrel protein [Hyphomicrobiaceae bacterium]
MRRRLSVLIAALAALICFSTAADAQEQVDPLYSVDADNFQISAPAYQGFYIRADVGVADWSLGTLDQAELAENGGSFADSSLARSAVLGGGLGWAFRNGFRLDLTGEHRTKARLAARDNLTVDLVDPDGALQANTDYAGHLGSYVGLLNGYWDIMHAGRFTPYVGAGIGVARSELSGFTTASSSIFTDADTGEQARVAVTGESASHSTTKFAWALMAGTSIDLTRDAKLDLGYRYLNLGAGSPISASTDLLICHCNAVGSPLTIDGLDAHEFRIGLRWLLDAGERAGNHVPLK